MTPGSESHSETYHPLRYWGAAALSLHSVDQSIMLFSGGEVVEEPQMISEPTYALLSLCLFALFNSTSLGFSLAFLEISTSFLIFQLEQSQRIVSVFGN